MSVHRGRTKPEISVVICTRNRRSMLAEAVASVRVQEGVASEILIVDDASTDDTPAYLASLPAESFRCFTQPMPAERAASRNLGLMEAQGDLIMFLDDDDRLSPGALEVLKRGLDRHPQAVAAVGARRDWFVAEQYRRRDVHPRFARCRHVFDELLFGWSAVSGQNLFRTRLLRELGGFDSAVIPCEDRDLWLRVARLGPVILLPETVMTYRVHCGQWRPPDIRRLREQVARRAIRTLPRPARRRGLRLRHCTALIDRAEDAFRARRHAAGIVAALRAFALAPAFFASPLIGPWVVRRLAGRIWHAWHPGAGKAAQSGATAPPPVRARWTIPGANVAASGASMPGRTPAGANRIEVSVIICTRDRGDRVVRTIESILRNRDGRWDLLIVDQTAGDGTAASVRRFVTGGRVRYLPSPETGLARARNFGVAATQGEIIAFTDDDCEVAQDWIERIVEAFAIDNKIQIVFGEVAAAPHDRTAGFIPSYEIPRPFIAKSVRDKSRVDGMGACMALRRGAWAARRGFDPCLGAGTALRSAEENDFALRTLLAGEWVHETPAVRVTHHGFDSKPGGWDRIAGYMFGSGAMFAKQFRLGHREMLPLLTQIFWRWIFRRPLVRYAASRRRMLRLLWFCRGWWAGMRMPLDRNTGNFDYR